MDVGGDWSENEKLGYPRLGEVDVDVDCVQKDEKEDERILEIERVRFIWLFPWLSISTRKRVSLPQLS